jgi:hypothetical protein
MNAMLLAFGAACLAAAQATAALAQTEVATRRECMQAIRQQGVRGFALEQPRFTRTAEGSSLTGRMVQGPARLDFTCATDRQAKVTDLTLTRPGP